MKKSRHLPLLAFVSFLLILSSCGTQKHIVTYTDTQYPKHEFRGAWLSTAWQNRYKNMDAQMMQSYLVTTLDQLQEMGINAVIFQARPQADAFYRPGLEPWSAWMTGTQGTPPDKYFDMLDFLTKECHKRNMELHAWLNPYRVTISVNDKLASNHLYYREPSRFVEFDGKIYFDPGIPANREYICAVVRDIVRRYQVDAIHMDDYFYPYPVAGKEFPDENSFLAHGLKQGFEAGERAAWRRNNVNQLVRDIKMTIASIKPWVRFGISPFGIYRNKANTPDGSGSDTRGLQNYDDLYADVTLWAKNGWIDYNMPQVYWEIGHNAADYNTLVKWWGENSHDIPLYIGQDVKRTMDAVSTTRRSQLSDKMMLSRATPQVQGNCFWPAYELQDNYKNIANELVNDFHKYPALIPPYVHMHHKQPQRVKNLQEKYTEKTHQLTWKSNKNSFDPETALYFVIYRFGKGEKENLNNPQHIVGFTRDSFYDLPYEGGKAEYKYVITAVDAFHNESKGVSKKVKL